MKLFRLIKGFSASLALLVFLIGSTTMAFAHSLIHSDTTPHIVFITSAHKNSDFTEVTFPLHVGISPLGPVYYVVTDTSNQSLATHLGINYMPKLANAKGTAAVEVVKKTSMG